MYVKLHIKCNDYSKVKITKNIHGYYYNTDS